MSRSAADAGWRLSLGGCRLFPFERPSPRPAELNLLERLAIWTALCWISAGPSFYLAANQWDVGGMVVGVFVFVAFYTLLGGTELVRQLRRDRLVNRTFWIGYGTRVAFSVALLTGGVLDLFLGMISVSMAESIWGDSRGFGASLGTTLIQGTTMNLLLGIYMLLVYALLRLFTRKPPAPGLCATCGYDLRGSHGSARCPECGTPTPWADRVVVAADTP